VSRARPLLTAGLALAAAALTLVYLLPFRAYGLQVEDEGTLLYQVLRVVEGQVPYVDFLTGYMPGYFYVGSTMLSWAGDVPTMRVLIAVLHALTVAGSVVLATRVARPALALALPLLYVAFLPVFPGSFCSFNIPYPSWFATAGWIAGALALTSYVERRGRLALVVAGAAAAFTFMMKPNAGLFVIAAATGVLLLAGARGARERPVGMVLWFVLWAGVLAGTVVTIGAPQPVDAIIYYTPVVALMAVLVTRRSGRTTLVGDAAVLLGTFAAGIVPWLAWFLARLGLERFLREMLYVGSNAAQVFYSSYPAVTGWALVVTALIVLFGGVGALAERGRVSATAALVFVGSATVASALAVATFGLMPERFTWSVIWQLESAAFAVALTTEVAGVVWLWRARRAPEMEVPAALLVCAVFMHLQLYPRADFMHLVSSGVLAAVVATFLLDRACGWWEAALRRSLAPWLAPAVLPTIVLLFAAAIAIGARPAFGILRSEARYTLPFAVAPVWVEVERGADLRALGDAATALAGLTGPRAPSVGFPALEIALLLSGTRNPTPYTYFVPGRPNHLEEASIVDTLAATRPAALISLNREFTFFDAAPTYFFLLRDLVRARYTLDGRFGRFDVLRRVDGVPAAADRPRAPSSAAPEGAAPSADVDAAIVALERGPQIETRLRAIGVLEQQPAARVAGVLLASATDDDTTIRQTAVRALLAVLAREPDRGLEDYVEAAHLDRRQQTLLLRAIRDSRDARAASYLFGVARGADPRLRADALGAMSITRAAMIARSHLWAGAEEPAAWPGRAAVVDGVHALLQDPGAPFEGAAFAAELAGRLGVADTVPVLRERLAAKDAVAASSARSLVTLAPEGVACDLVALLVERPNVLEIEEAVPSALIALARLPAPVGAEARACITRALTPGHGVLENAVWIAAALGDPSFVPSLRALLPVAAPEVRRAAVWTLGEIAADAETTALLERIAHADADPKTRELAATAVAKQSGGRPRGLAVSAAMPAPTGPSVAR
jgi:hypothetical protein